jgi:hypothetical protein
MTNLRELLRSQDPELYAALENSVKVARKDIFPALSSKDESLNSSPHSQNLENYLNSILGIYPDLFRENSKVNMTPHELYCILMAVLFHDTGRIMFDEGHGSFSKLYITNNYLRFHIPMEELADAIGDICEFHKPVNEIKPKTIFLDAGIGQIRILELAELLKLVDEMDTTYRRLKPLYILDQQKYFSVKGLFRNYINGVNYDAFTESIFVSIDNKIISNTDLGISNIHLITFLNKKNKSALKISKTFDQGIPPKKLNIYDLIFGNKITQEIKNYNFCLRNWDIQIEPKFSKKFIKELNESIDKFSDKFKRVTESYKILETIKKAAPDSEKLRLYYYFLHYHKESGNYDKFVAFIKDIEKETNKKWPLCVVLPLLFKAVNTSQENTCPSRYLSRLGIHVKKWFVYYQEHIYDVEGNESFEPIFNVEYLIHISQCMWKLSNQIPFQSKFSFETLASEVLETDIKKLKLAVKRINILTSTKNKSIIWYDDRSWEWENENLKYVISLLETLKT